MPLRLNSLRDLPPHIQELNKPPQPTSGVSSYPGSFARKPRKYRNEPAYGPDGERYDSKLELECCMWMKARWEAGEILWFTRQVNFELEGGVVYRADFLAPLAKGGVEVIDATGLLTQKKKNKLKGMKARYGIDVLLWPPPAEK